jgi:uncharacterized protein (DUF427 family)
MGAIATGPETSFSSRTRTKKVIFVGILAASRANKNVSELAAPGIFYFKLEQIPNIIIF